MRKSKINKNFLYFSIFISSFIITPILGLWFTSSFNGSISAQNLTIDKNSLLFLEQDKNKINSINTENYDIRKYSVYDNELAKFLNDLQISQPSTSEQVKIIISFDNDIKKSDRINLINSVLENYQIIYNYDIISSVYLRCDVNELIEKGANFQSISRIKRISKSKSFSNPVIVDKMLKPSSLSKNDYDNWWLDAIEMDKVGGGLDGSGVKVAVIDTGIYEHPDLNYDPSSITARNFVSAENDAGNIDDFNGHGTHCAGIIGSDGGGSSGLYKGVAPGVSLISARAGNETGGLDDGDIISAIEWLVQTAKPDIISMSFGGGYPEAHDPMSEAISKASDQGIICVVAAGNSGPDYYTGKSPGTCIDVITVGATDESNNLASFSSWGPSYSYLAYPDVVAPGVNIIATESPGSVISVEKRFIGDDFDFSGDADYVPLSGTSMATPMVAGACAILKQKYPELSPETARIALIEGAQKLTDDDDSSFLKSGAGLINVSASIEFLDNIYSTYGNVNKTAIFFPNSLPIKPFDILHFPGDHHEFNITILSGFTNTYDIKIPNNINGVSLNTDKTQITFDNASVSFFTLDIKIDKDAEPGVRNFLVNLTNATGGQLLDILNVSLDIRLPEYKILMESFHGLNDWNPSPSYEQVGFYEAMKDLSELNISINYDMEYWTPNYDLDKDNSMLVEERLAQYDLIVLQSPILPYSPNEINSLMNYFNDGGNILLLGTRYQDLPTESLNYLLSSLNTGISINEENIMDVNWYGLGAVVSWQDVSTFSSTPIFNGVNKFRWKYGNSFSVSGNAESIASLNGKTVAVAYNGSSEGKGKLVAFGSSHWIHYKYTKSGYYQDHYKIISNLMDYLLPKDDYSINIDLRSEQVSNSRLNLTIHVKNQSSDSPLDSLTLNSSLKVKIQHMAYNKEILMGSIIDGISTNYTYNIPSTDYRPYNITVNLTIGAKSYNKTSKILYYLNAGVPKILNLTPSVSPVNRGSSLYIIAKMGSSDTYDVDAYFSLKPRSFYNTRKSINITLKDLDKTSNIYDKELTILSSYPSGNAYFYITTKHSTSNYINWTSPRRAFSINNNDPEINEEKSSFTFNEQSFNFDDTQSSSGAYLVPVEQGLKLDFVVKASDIEDSRLNVYIFLVYGGIVTTSEGAVIYPIFPKSIDATELSDSSEGYVGSFTIPDSLTYSSISGDKSISTMHDYEEGYVGLLYIFVTDSEGGSDSFLLILEISETPFPWLLILLIVLGIIGIVVIIAVVIIKKKKRKNLGY